MGNKRLCSVNDPSPIAILSQNVREGFLGLVKPLYTYLAGGGEWSAPRDNPIHALSRGVVITCESYV